MQLLLPIPPAKPPDPAPALSLREFSAPARRLLVALWPERGARVWSRVSLVRAAWPPRKRWNKHHLFDVLDELAARGVLVYRVPYGDRVWIAIDEGAAREAARDPGADPRPGDVGQVGVSRPRRVLAVEDDVVRYEGPRGARTVSIGAWRSWARRIRPRWTRARSEAAAA